MEDFSTRTYGTSGLDNRPLFGETSAKDRIINLVVGSLTSLLILVTLISAFVFPQLPPKPLNIFFAVCISLSSITACILLQCTGFLLQWPLVAEHGLNSYGAMAYLLHCMWDLPGPVIEPMFTALAGEFSTTGPPGKSCRIHFEERMCPIVSEDLEKISVQIPQPASKMSEAY